MKNTKNQKKKLALVSLSKGENRADLQYKRVRNVCGLLGVILPWIALFSAGLMQQHPHEQWWYSISATYYQSPALVGILTPAAIVLMLYVGYEPIDNIVTGLSGLFALCVVLFPCRVPWIPEMAPVGFFQVPMDVSNTIHCSCACLFFLLLALNSLLLFTKSNGDMTPRKRIRNHIYRVCGIAMLVVMVIFAVLVLLDAPGWTTMVVEILLLFFFGVSWLVKGNAFPFLNDVSES